MKAAAGRAILDAGGTITHHHGVGRDHRPWYDAQRPDAFAAALRAAKHALDPAGLLNPGVLIDPWRRGAARGPGRGRVGRAAAAAPSASPEQLAVVVGELRAHVREPVGRVVLERREDGPRVLARRRVRDALALAHAGDELVGAEALGPARRAADLVGERVAAAAPRAPCSPCA